MNKKHLIKNVIFTVFFSLLMFTGAQASKPLWIFVPETPTQISVAINNTAQVIYTVQNQSSRAKSLLMKSIPGVSQTAPCQLPARGSCTLSLSINGAALEEDVVGGPVLCEQGNPLQCYQPGSANILRIHRILIPQYTVTPSAGANGSISPSTPQVVSIGDSLTFTATPDANFGVNQWLLDGVVVQTGGTTYQLTNIQANHTVQVTFQQFIVIPTAGPNGSISPSTPQAVSPGSDLTFTATPNAAFAVDQWLLDGVPVQDGGTTYQLTNIQANHTVDVTFAQAVLTPATLNLALSTNSPAADPPLAGTARIIRVQNTGTKPALNVQVTAGTFPTGTSITSNTCTGTLNISATCDITITPGSTASLDISNNPCTTAPGTTPQATVVTISADNASPANVNVLILGYGCIYEGGFLFAVDNATPTTGSIGGKVAAEADESTTLVWSTVDGNTAADSTTDGLANSNILATPVGQYPAAQACLNKNESGITGWYLPAICELGRYVGVGIDAGCGTTSANLYITLNTNGLGNFAPNAYWSSTEWRNFSNVAWLQYFQNSLSPGDMGGGDKNFVFEVRCVRIFTP